MTPSPYKSKLLRLAIAQYRKGLDRHRRAVRYTRSTTVAAVELGTALALVPLLALAQVSQTAERRLKQSVKEGGLFGLGPSADKLLNFSDFDKTALDASAPVPASNFAEAVVAERSMVQILRSVGERLSWGQLKLLSMNIEGKAQLLGSGVLTKALGRAVVPVGRQITGVASDLETRSLLLVIGHSLVWNGLSAAQQIQLQRQIDRFVLPLGQLQTRHLSDSTTSTLDRKGDAFVAKKQSVLTQPFRSFWVEVLKAVVWMRRQYQRRAAPKLVGGRDQIEGSDCVSRAFVGVAMPSHAVGAIAKPFLLTTVSYKVLSFATGADKIPTAALTIRDVDSPQPQEKQPYCLEADVMTVGYVEHPFEELLKWVDRILLWLETQWQGVKRRLGL